MDDLAIKTFFESEGQLCIIKQALAEIAQRSGHDEFLRTKLNEWSVPGEIAVDESLDVSAHGWVKDGANKAIRDLLIYLG